jgi:hypothetical protein
MWGDDVPERRLLIVVRGDEKPLPVIQRVTEIMNGLSRGKTHLAFNSADGTLVGLYAKSTRPLPVIRAALEGPSSYKDRGFVLVLEIGEDFQAIGNSRGWQWLQH